MNMLPSCLPEGCSDLQDCQNGQTLRVSPRPGQRITLDLLPCQYQLLFTFYFSCCYFFHCNRNVSHFRKFGKAESYMLLLLIFSENNYSLFFPMTFPTQEISPCLVFRQIIRVRWWYHKGNSQHFLFSSCLNKLGLGFNVYSIPQIFLWWEFPNSAW